MLKYHSIVRRVLVSDAGRNFCSPLSQLQRLLWIWWQMSFVISPLFRHDAMLLYECSNHAFCFLQPT